LEEKLVWYLLNKLTVIKTQRETSHIYYKSCNMSIQWVNMKPNMNVKGE